MTHFDRCAPGHFLLTPGRMQVKAHIVSIVHAVYSTCTEIISFVCVSSGLSDCYTRVGRQDDSLGKSQQQQQDTQAWLVGSHPPCRRQHAPGLTRPAICKLLLQASGFKRESLQHNVIKPQCPEGHLYKCVHVCTREPATQSIRTGSEQRKSGGWKILS